MLPTTPPGPPASCRRSYWSRSTSSLYVNLECRCSLAASTNPLPSPGTRRASGMYHVWRPAARAASCAAYRTGTPPGPIIVGVELWKAAVVVAAASVPYGDGAQGVPAGVWSRISHAVLARSAATTAAACRLGRQEGQKVDPLRVQRPVDGPALAHGVCHAVEPHRPPWAAEQGGVAAVDVRNAARPLHVGYGHGRLGGLSSHVPPETAPCPPPRRRRWFSHSARRHATILPIVSAMDDMAAPSNASAAGCLDMPVPSSHLPPCSAPMRATSCSAYEPPRRQSPPPPPPRAALPLSTPDMAAVPPPPAPPAPSMLEL